MKTKWACVLYKENTVCYFSMIKRNVRKNIVSRKNLRGGSPMLFVIYKIFYLPVCARVLSRFSCVQLFATLWTVAHQAPLSMGFFRQEYWSGLPCPPPGDLPNPGIEPTVLMSPALAGRSFNTGATWEAPYLPLLLLLLLLSRFSCVWLCATP